MNATNDPARATEVRHHPPRPTRQAPALMAIGVALALQGGCAYRSNYQPRPLAADEHAAVRDQVRRHAKAHCGTCHQASLPTAKPAALAIYNLDRDDWAAMLTEERLRNGFPRRLNARLDDTGRRQLRRFVEAELALRAAQ